MQRFCVMDHLNGMDQLLLIVVEYIKSIYDQLTIIIYIMKIILHHEKNSSHIINTTS